MLVNESGEIAGAVSGGCVDGVIVEACDQVFRSRASRSMAFSSDQGELGDAGLLCGGKLRVWIYEIHGPTARTLLDLSGHYRMTLQGPLEQGPESIKVEPMANAKDHERTVFCQHAAGEWEFSEVFGQRPFLMIIGYSGFTASLAAMARFLGCEVWICEPRSRFAAAVSDADHVVKESPDRCIERVDQQGKLDSDSAILVCTHDRKFDQPALRAAVRSKAGFVGAMGSRQTVLERRERLLASGLSDQELARIHSPLGLDLRAETPAETAVSVFAQWIARRNGGSGMALQQTEGSIHGRA